MALLVKKFGGSSLADHTCLRRVASLIAEDVALGQQVVVVVSAQAGETDRLVKAAVSISALPDVREYDALLSSAEQASAALLSLMLIEQSIPAVSLSAHQSGITTNTNHAKASIEQVDASIIMSHLSRGRVVVVAGFQGMTHNGDIATLGRGGSDMTAVVLAGELQADECQIYTDVAGVFNADPRVIPEATCLPRIFLADMLSYSRLGAAVMQQQALDYGYQHAVPMRVLSTFGQGVGTQITREPFADQPLCIGVACQRAQVAVTIRGESSLLMLEQAMVRWMQQEEMNYDFIGMLHGRDLAQGHELAWVMPNSQVTLVKAWLVERLAKYHASVSVSESLSVKVSLVGSAMVSHHAIASALYAECEHQTIPILAMTSNEHRVSVLVNESYAESTTRVFFRYVESSSVVVEKKSVKL